MRLFVLALFSIFLSVPAVRAGRIAKPPELKKIVFLAGTKSHGPGDHEYEKACRLLARCLETSPNAPGYKTEVHLYGWPEDESTLDDADCIVLYSDGSDHDERAHPLLAGRRLEKIRAQMKRGCGLVLLHYAVFAPVKRGGPEYLEWVGGFFDYETGSAPNKWYSAIKFCTARPEPATPSHPISRGLAPFELAEEYYYKMRFAKNDRRRVPILNVQIPGEPETQTVAWAVQRKEGGRGFAFTGGHPFRNFENDDVRRMILNAIVWTAKGEVPAEGVRSALDPNLDSIDVLLLTGYNHPAHDWEATTQALREILGKDGRIRITVLEDPERLATADLSPYEVILQNYCNWDRPPISSSARSRLLTFVRAGTGLVVVHFANGAFLDWPEYRKLARRVWVEGKSGHDPYGTFGVRVLREHPVTWGVPNFETTDELYFNQEGDERVTALVSAVSKVTGKEETLAFVYEEGKGRVFQTLLGHAAESIRAPGHAELLRRSVAWVAGREVRP